MKTKILNYIIEKDLRSGHSNGCYFSELVNKLQIEPAQVKAVLKELLSEKTVLLRDGGNGKLIMYNRATKK